MHRCVQPASELPCRTVSYGSNFDLGGLLELAVGAGSQGARRDASSWFLPSPPAVHDLS
jgi:hypothetical protein